MRTLTLAILTLTAAPAFAADEAKKLTYDEHVMPIFRQKCLGCHNPDKAGGGLDLSTYPAMMLGGGSGEVIAAGDPNGSRLFKLTDHSEEPKMPPNSPKIDDAMIATLRSWIEGGILENSGSKPVQGKPKAEVALGSVVRGRPETMPMPTKPLPLEVSVATERANAVTAMAANPWSPLVAVGGQRQILIYNSDTLELVGVLPFEHGVPHVLKFSRNGSLLLAGGGHAALLGKAVLYDVATGEAILEVGNEADVVLAADISADQKKIAIGGPSKVVRIFSCETGEMIQEIRKHTDWIYQIEFSPDAVLLATGDRTGGLFVWESYSGNEFHMLKGHTNAITAMSWRGDSNALATGSEDGSVRLWEMQNGGNFKNWNAHGGVLSVQFSHEGDIVTSGRDKTARLWDGNGGAKKAFPALPELALQAVITHDGKTVIAGDWGGAIRVWETQDGKELGQLSSNPPKLADRLASARKAQSEAEEKYLTADDAVAAAEKQIGQKTAALEAAKREAEAAVKAAADARANLEKAKQAHAQSVDRQKAAREALDKAKAQKKPDEELKAATDALAASDEAVKKAQADVAAADQAVKTTAGAVKPAQDRVPAADAELKAAREQLPKAQAALDEATAVLEAAEARVQRLEEAATLAKN